jgi:hypothetical protein
VNESLDKCKASAHIMQLSKSKVMVWLALLHPLTPSSYQRGLGALICRDDDACGLVQCQVCRVPEQANYRRPLGVVVSLMARSAGWSDAGGDRGRAREIALLLERLLTERGTRPWG